jgi:hypothetical protein
MNGKTMIKGAAIVAVALVCASASRVYASATVGLGAEDSVYFGLASGLALPTGDAVYMGQFSVSDATVAALSSGGTLTPNNYATLVSDFVPLNVTSLALIGAGTAGSPGSITATYEGNNGTFAGGAIYLMVVNAPTTTGATQVGVFKGDSTWTYPANMVSGSTAIDTDSALTTPLIGTFAASVNAAVNGYTYDVVSGNNYGIIGALELAPIAVVPEPSSIALVVMGLFGAIGMIRRRRQS